jgi:hypothetical protein
MYPFYGYNGWYKDVIKKLEGQKKYSDTELNILARAYSTYASALLSDQLGYSIPEESFNPPLAMNCLTQEQIKKYQAIEDTAISLFKRLKEQNPDFETIVGNISIKYANEIMVEFHGLLTYSRDYAKDIKLPDNLYPDSIIRQTKGWMNNCPENAIYFSFGDNDFYPFLYVQQHDRFRRDIYVVNYSLLAIDRYIYTYNQPLFESPKVELGADTSLYHNNKNAYIYLKKSSSSYSIDEMLNKLRGLDPNKVPQLDRNHFLIRGKNQKQEEDTTSVSVVPNIEFEGEYILKNQWIVLDIFDHLNGRDFISQYSFYDELKNLGTFLEWNGEVFKYKYP